MTKQTANLLEYLNEGTFTSEELHNALGMKQKDIKFLESIYMTGGENNHFSEDFKNAADHERNEICLITSKIHSLIREVKS